LSVNSRSLCANLIGWKNRDPKGESKRLSSLGHRRSYLISTSRPRSQIVVLLLTLIVS
jgi:hypothetical protein